jgi:hypothetical protein
MELDEGFSHKMRTAAKYMKLLLMVSEYTKLRRKNGKRMPKLG